MEADHSQEVARCLNCAHEVTGPFCTHCGQSTRDLRVSVWSLTGDFLSNFFSLDSKLIRSLTPLCLRPGLLTRAFIDGKRVRFLPPVRMYLVFSLFFFLSITLTNPDLKTMGKPDEAREIEKVHEKLASFQEKGVVTDADAVIDQLKTAQKQKEKGAENKEADGEDDQVIITGFHIGDKSGKAGDRDEAELKTDTGSEPENTEGEPGLPEDLVAEAGSEEESTESTVPERVTVEMPKLPTITTDYVNLEGIPNAEEIQDMIEEEKKAGKEQEEKPDEEKGYMERMADKYFVDKAERLEEMDFKEIVALFYPLFMKQLNWALFFMMPFFALLLKMLYIRRDPLYLDHLIFAFHYHSFVFFLFTVLMWWDFLLPVNLSTPIDFVQTLAPPIYLYKAMRRVYGQGRWKTMAKLFILGFFYMMLLGFTMTVSGLITFLTADI
ncbi:MAG: DUF3667 domain-containing protein [Acidobacteriota bacterium]|nr:DUF3667 domain-containing protein [Acidobacteriota bacterium]